MIFRIIFPIVYCNLKVNISPVKEGTPKKVNINKYLPDYGPSFVINRFL